MENKDIARTEYNEVAQIFSELLHQKKPLEEMCAFFHGRLDQMFGLFDFDYKHLTATVLLQSGKPSLSPYVEFWSENGWDYELFSFPNSCSGDT